MDPTVLVNLALAVLNQVLAMIAQIKGQSGLTDDQILAEAQKVTAGNDAAYQALVAALKASPTPPAA
jgi:hypothetical protein